MRESDLPDGFEMHDVVRLVVVRSPMSPEGRLVLSKRYCRASHRTCGSFGAPWARCWYLRWKPWS
jgi:hypothetical protein